MSRLIQPTAVLATMLIVELFPQAQAFQLGSSVLQLPGCADLARPGRALAAPLRAASRARRSGLLCARGQGDDGKFDLLSGKDFDLLALRSFRREAKLRYSNLNQSEPLRIQLFGLIAFLAASAPDLARGLETTISPTERAASLAVAFAAFAGFLRERSRRTAQLVRMDRECAISDLSVSFLEPLSGARKTFGVRELREKLRILVVYGDRATLRATLPEAAAFRRRFQQAEVAFVAVSSDGSKRSEWGEPAGVRGGWLWEAASPAEWREYMDSILAEKTGAAEQGAWLAMNKKGRSRASGLGVPAYDELLGSRLPPTAEVELGDGPDATPEDAGVRDAQAAFYAALTGGDEAGMAALWDGGYEEPGVSEFMELGGRLDPWAAQLRAGARPEGMEIGSRDVTLLDGGEEAWSTCLEVPAGGGGQTLLASQRWRKDAGGAWRLRAHRTIPFFKNSGAGAVLRCDARGCVLGLRDLDPQGPLDLPRADRP